MLSLLQHSKETLLICINDFELSEEIEMENKIWYSPCTGPSRKPCETTK